MSEVYLIRKRDELEYSMHKLDIIDRVISKEVGLFELRVLGLDVVALLAQHFLDGGLILAAE